MVITAPLRDDLDAALKSMRETFKIIQEATLTASTSMTTPTMHGMKPFAASR
jgi:hypothetical protein